MAERSDYKKVAEMNKTKKNEWQNVQNKGIIICIIQQDIRNGRMGAVRGMDKVKTRNTL